MFESPDPELDTALELAKSDPYQAAQVLRIAARYLQNHEKLPSSLAMYLADAFEKSMKKASMFRGSELLANLNLKAMNRRPSANFEHVGMEFSRLIASKIPRGLAIQQLASTYKVTDRTVERMIAEYRGHQEREASEFVQELHHYSQKTLPQKIKK